MKNEYYQQISTFYVSGDDTIKDDEQAPEILNVKINSWAKAYKKLYLNFNYRITNVEHTALPNPSWSVGTPKIMVSVNIAYTID